MPWKFSDTLETSFNDFGIEFVQEFEYTFNVISLIKIKLAIKIVNRVILFMNELLSKEYLDKSFIIISLSLVNY